MAVLFANNARTTLAGGITSGATSLTVASGTGTLFPSPTGGDYFVATLINTTTLADEIIHVTSRTSDTMTIVRAQEGTVALAWNSGDTFAMLMTAGVANAFLQVTAAFAVPSGAVFAYANNVAPAGYLECNGAALAAVSYPNLFAAIGYLYGGSAGVFNLPDLRGYFVRGWDDGRGIDTGRSLGTNQQDEFQGHRHPPISPGTSFRQYQPGGSQDSNSGAATGFGVTTGDPVTDGTNGTPRTGGETRPINMALMYIIKT